MKSAKTSGSLFGTILVLFLVFCSREAGAGIVKRGFVDLGCMGQYDRSVFTVLDRVCEDCYNLYREPGLHMECRKYCFSNDYFKGCTKALLLDDKELQTMVDKIIGSQP